MATPRVQIAHPLFDRLQDLDKEVARRFLDALFPGLWTVGLRLDRRLDESRYSTSTPLNCRTFANTGGDGVHFSFLVQEDTVHESSPVVVTVPCAAASLVAGEDLFDFLCLGAHRGYFALEQLAYETELTLEVFTDPNWQPTKPWHDSVGFVPNEEKRHLLAFLTRELGLRPWSSAARFAELQERFGGFLELPSEV
jgi:hypothetical protein